MNILLIMTDQQRWDTLGCYGNEAAYTPNLDWLASEGTVFEHAYTTSPSCVPARASLISGMKPWHTGVLGMGRGQGPMGVGFAHTLPGELAKVGYHTQGVGKMHFWPQRTLNGFHNTVLDESGRVESVGFLSDYLQWFEKSKTGDYGFVDHGIDWNSWMARPYHAPEFLHPSNWTVNESIKFLKERDPAKPFFLKTSFARPHSPYDPPQFYYDLFKAKKLPQPFLGDWSCLHDVPEDAAKPDAWRGKRSGEETHRARAGYYGAISHIDSQIGRLLIYLRNSGLLDETLIIFTSDHGDMLGDHNLWRKTYAYEGSAHIPFIIRYPRGKGFNHVSRSDVPVCLEDIMPTCLATVGAAIPDSMDGVNLLGAMRGEQVKGRNFIHGEHCACYADDNEMHYLTDGKWKYIWFPRTGAEQLFHLQVDKGECRDLARDADHSSILDTWRQELIVILDERNAGLVENNRLVCQAGAPPIVSPHYMARKERAGFAAWK
ncbi:arylsulfatase [Paenibacillus sp. P36]|uniref:arylsulfatase n=1 Tax=Paenibacillus sp. P36 TaxID=3342538 RepID=UPI0038B3E623